ncbi:predicted protein [Phaeodactylum tricornutum CCAP 1055/1]|jgi:hypothetical protein|uniref:CHCH domain-containing protein n=1 Tax=Phaeodactylum tricornutum (strain CCAP 1055/1) TaxID=556484 RepID=B7FUY2_PHATC|nr:predicted protein [Phaeodactylum tricornutum CCAP 1055/1]EEC50064.1 predicted protein [Phaeodactylum tricornutum CCAP 1055/1]|eukprot:XP_002178399.1 predicted protein [Phaeodactylum tricornutum CCAP 1055/1]
MARSRRGGGGSFGRAAPSRPAARPASRPVSRPASTQAKPATTPAPQQSTVPAPQSSGGGGMLSGIGSTIAQGMAFGTGSAIAHRAVGAVAGSFGGGEAAAPEPNMAAGVDAAPANPSAIQGACAQDKTMFYECLQHNQGDQQACHFLYEQLQQCQQGQNQMQFS